jgi:NADH-quinone oxidoreductase subunit G
MPKLTIDGRKSRSRGLDRAAGLRGWRAEIPRFCYHERLNDRRQLPHVPGRDGARAPKPIASCAMPAADGMVIKTDTPKVHKARKG